MWPCSSSLMDVASNDIVSLKGMYMKTNIEICKTRCSENDYTPLDKAILIFHLENPRSRSWVRSKFKVTPWVQHSIDSHPFRSMHVNRPSIIEIHKFLNLTLKIQGEGEIRMMLHNHRSRQFHITSNGINQSRDMASTKSGPSTASFD